MSGFHASFNSSDTFNATLKESGNLKATFGMSGGSSGTKDYNKLINQPQIEDRVLIGNKTFEQLGLSPMTFEDIDNLIFRQ